MILTALGLEYEAVRAYLGERDFVRHETGTVFEVGTLAGTAWRTALAEVGEGNDSAAVVTEQARQLFSPRALLFVGVAGALKDDLTLGDVVVATRVHSVHGGKDAPEGFLARPEGWAGSHELVQSAKHALRGQSWHTASAPGDTDGQRHPRVHFKPVAAGDVVLNSATSVLRQQLRTHYNDAVAIEMESAGMAHAAQIGRIEALTIRGISDMADGNKYAEADTEHQPRAAAHAAAAAVAVIRHLPPPQALSAPLSRAPLPSSDRDDLPGSLRSGRPLSLRHLLSCFAEAPLPLYVLSPAAISAVGIPELSADRVAVELSEFTVEPVTASGEPGEPRVPCIRVGAAAPVDSACETPDERARLCTYAGALLDHAVAAPPNDSSLPLLTPHVLALLWRRDGDPARSVTAARRVRDAYLARGRYEEGLPLAVQLVMSGQGDLKDDLALGQLHSGRGDFGEAEVVLRRVLATAEKDAAEHGLSLVGRTGPSMRDVLTNDAEGPFTRDLSQTQCDVLGFAARVQHALGNALYGLRRYPESERLLQAAVGLLWRTQGAEHPGRLLAQMHRAQAVARQHRWEEALGLVHDVIPWAGRLRLDQDSPETDALIRLAHAEVTAEIVASRQRGDRQRTRGVGMFPAPVVKWLGRTVTPTRPDRLTWTDVRSLCDDAIRACERAFGGAHPRTTEARAVRGRASEGMGG